MAAPSRPGVVTEHGGQASAWQFYPALATAPCTPLWRSVPEYLQGPYGGCWAWVTFLMGQYTKTGSPCGRSAPGNRCHTLSFAWPWPCPDGAPRAGRPWSRWEFLSCTAADMPTGPGDDGCPSCAGVWPRGSLFVWLGYGENVPPARCSEDEILSVLSRNCTMEIFPWSLSSFLGPQTYRSTPWGAQPLWYWCSKLIPLLCWAAMGAMAVMVCPQLEPLATEAGTEVFACLHHSQ